MRNRGSNLFSIDQSAIERILAEANHELLEKVERHLEDGRTLVSSEISGATVAAFEEYFRNTKALKKEVSIARLSDGRPFSDAVKVVKDWFSRPEGKLKKAEDNLRIKLNEYLKETRSREATQTSQGAAQESQVGISIDGTPVISFSASPSLSAPSENGLSIETEWIVDSYDVETIDFNNLKVYFSDHAIKIALAKHLKAVGPNQIEGVSYVRGIRK